MQQVTSGQPCKVPSVWALTLDLSYNGCTSNGIKIGWLNGQGQGWQDDWRPSRYPSIYTQNHAHEDGQQMRDKEKKATPTPTQKYVYVVHNHCHEVIGAAWYNGARHPMLQTSSVHTAWNVVK